MCELSLGMRRRQLLQAPGESNIFHSQAHVASSFLKALVRHHRVKPHSCVNHGEKEKRATSVKPYMASDSQQCAVLLPVGGEP